MSPVQFGTRLPPPRPPPLVIASSSSSSSSYQRSKKFYAYYGVGQQVTGDANQKHQDHAARNINADTNPALLQIPISVRSSENPSDLYGNDSDLYSGSDPYCGEPLETLLRMSIERINHFPFTNSRVGILREKWRQEYEQILVSELLGGCGASNASERTGASSERTFFDSNPLERKLLNMKKTRLLTEWVKKLRETIELLEKAIATTISKDEGVIFDYADHMLQTKPAPELQKIALDLLDKVHSVSLVDNMETIILLGNHKRGSSSTTSVYSISDTDSTRDTLNAIQNRIGTSCSESSSKGSLKGFTKASSDENIIFKTGGAISEKTNPGTGEKVTSKEAVERIQKKSNICDEAVIISDELLSATASRYVFSTRQNIVELLDSIGDKNTISFIQNTSYYPFHRKLAQYWNLYERKKQLEIDLKSTACLVLTHKSARTIQRYWRKRRERIQKQSALKITRCWKNFKSRQERVNEILLKARQSISAWRIQRRYWIYQIRKLSTFSCQNRQSVSSLGSLDHLHSSDCIHEITRIQAYTRGFLIRRTADPREERQALYHFKGRNLHFQRIFQNLKERRRRRFLAQFIPRQTIINAVRTSFDTSSFENQHQNLNFSVNFDAKGVTNRQEAGNTPQGGTHSRGAATTTQKGTTSSLAKQNPFIPTVLGHKLMILKKIEAAENLLQERAHGEYEIFEKHWTHYERGLKKYLEKEYMIGDFLEDAYLCSNQNLPSESRRRALVEKHIKSEKQKAIEKFEQQVSYNRETIIGALEKEIGAVK